MFATAEAVKKLANGQPATVEGVAELLGIRSRGAVTQRLVAAHNAGLITKAGRFGWAPVGWTGNENRTSGRWRRKPR